MKTDFEIIIEELKMEFPFLLVEQVKVKYPTDDDGLWFLSIPGIPQDVNLESANSVNKFLCPFMIETNEQCCRNSLLAPTVADAVRLITKYMREVPNGHPVILDGKKFLDQKTT